MSTTSRSLSHLPNVITVRKSISEGERRPSSALFALLVFSLAADATLSSAERWPEVYTQMATPTRQQTHLSGLAASWTSTTAARNLVLSTHTVKPDPSERFIWLLREPGPHGDSGRESVRKPSSQMRIYVMRDKQRERFTKWLNQKSETNESI